MSHTRKLRDQYLNGADIVASVAPVFTGREDGRWPVLYAPRNDYDPQPWVAFGSNPEAQWRYSGREVEVLPILPKGPRHLAFHGDTEGICGKPAKRTTTSVGRTQCQDCLREYDIAMGLGHG